MNLQTVTVVIVVKSKATAESLLHDIGILVSEADSARIIESHAQKSTATEVEDFKRET